MSGVSGRVFESSCERVRLPLMLMLNTGAPIARTRRSIDSVRFGSNSLCTYWLPEVGLHTLAVRFPRLSVHGSGTRTNNNGVPPFPSQSIIFFARGHKKINKYGFRCTTGVE